MAPNDEKLKSVSTVAVELGIPVAWLVREAKAGRIPAIRAGRALLCATDEVRESLSRRARGDAPPYTKDDVTPEDMDAIDNALKETAGMRDDGVGAWDTVDARAIVAAAWNLRRELDKAATISA